MSVRSIVVALVAWMCLPLTPVAHADTIGPACWRLGNDETYRLFFMLDSANPVAASVVGQAVATGFAPFPVSGGAIVSTGTQGVSMVLTVGPGVTGSTAFFVRADFSLNDLTGQAVCQLANGAAGGCGMGPRAWTPVACP